MGSVGGQGPLLRTLSLLSQGASPGARFARARGLACVVKVTRVLLQDGDFAHDVVPHPVARVLIQVDHDFRPVLDRLRLFGLVHLNDLQKGAVFVALNICAWLQKLTENVNPVGVFDRVFADDPILLAIRVFVNLAEHFTGRHPEVCSHNERFSRRDFRDRLCCTEWHNCCVLFFVVAGTGASQRQGDETPPLRIAFPR